MKNMKKQLCVILLIFVMMFSLCVQVHANGSGSFELHSTVESVYAGTLCTVSYYHPAEFPNVWAGFASYGGGYSDGGILYVIFYKDGTTFNCTSSGITFNQEVLITQVKSIAAMEDILFKGAVADYTKTKSGGPAWSNSVIYQEKDPAMRQNGAPKSLEAYYYEWYFANNGVYPVGIQIRIDYMCNGEIVETQVTETIAGNTILLQDIVQEPDGYAWDTINIAGNGYQKADSVRFTEDTDITVIMTATAGTGDVSGIIAKLEDIWKAITSLANPTPDYSFLADMNNKLAHKLEDNGFYTSVCAITRELTSIFNEDYSDPAKFHEINPLKLTLRKTVHASEDDGFNGSYSYGSIDWGVQDMSLVGDMRWFFGTHPSTGKGGGFINIDGSKAVKAYSDAIISAFLWVGFGFMLWQQLPNIISGEMGTIAGIAGEQWSHDAREQRTQEEMFAAKEYMTESSSTKKDGITYTYTKKRRLK